MSALKSARERHIELSDAAIDDFRDILSFTLQKWGENQFFDYRHKIDNALKTIGLNPKIGRIKHGFMVYKIGRHLILGLSQIT